MYHININNNINKNNTKSNDNNDMNHNVVHALNMWQQHQQQQQQQRNNVNDRARDRFPYFNWLLPDTFVTVDFFRRSTFWPCCWSRKTVILNLFLFGRPLMFLILIYLFQISKYQRYRTGLLWPRVPTLSPVKNLCPKLNYLLLRKTHSGVLR